MMMLLLLLMMMMMMRYPLLRSWLELLSLPAIRKVASHAPSSVFVADDEMRIAYMRIAKPSYSLLELSIALASDYDSASNAHPSPCLSPYNDATHS